MAALLHREDAIGIIVERIIGSDAGVSEVIRQIIGEMWVDPERPNVLPSVGRAIEVLGWPMVREISIVVMLHRVHAELAPSAMIDPVSLDQFALAVLSASVG